MNVVFQLSAKTIARLGDEELRRLIGHLFRADCVVSGRSVASMHLGMREAVPDGGCDALTDAGPIRTDWIPSVETCWQFKTGEQSQPGKIKGEIQKKVPHRVLSSGGAYYLVASSATTGSMTDKRLNQLVTDAAAAGLPTDSIRVVSAEDLSIWTAQRPAAAARFVGLAFSQFSVERVLGQRTHYSSPFVETESGAAQVKALRETLIEGVVRSNLTHVHIQGRPGVGKTRTALEAVAHESLAPVALYFDGPNEASRVLYQLGTHPDVALVAVVDRCESRDAVRIATDAAERCQARVALLTLGHISSQFRTDHALMLEVAPMDDETMQEALDLWHPGLSPEASRFVRRHSSGYPRLAHLFAAAILSSPDGETSIQAALNRDDVGTLLARLIPEEAAVIETLTALAVFKKVGCQGSVQGELRTVAETFGLEMARVRQHIRAANSRHPVVETAGNYIYVTPHPLALYLAARGIEDYADGLAQLAGRGPNQALTRALAKRTEELGENPTARAICEVQLTRYSNVESFTGEGGAALWCNLASAAPEPATRGLRRVLESADKDSVGTISGPTRRLLVNELVRRCWIAETFSDALWSLAHLATAENETWANNATGEFTARFGIVLGGTEVPFERRLDDLDAIVQRGGDYAVLGLQALGQALQHGETRMLHGEDQGGRVAPPEWHPASQADAAKCRELVLERLTALAEQSPPELGPTLTRLLNHSFAWLHHSGHGQQVERLFATVYTTFPSERVELLRQLASTIAIDKRGSTVAALKRLYDSVAGTGFTARLHLVNAQSWTGGASTSVTSLAQAASANPTQFREQLPWLTSGDAGIAYDLGRQLGLAAGPSFIDLLKRESLERPDCRLLAGYLMGCCEQQPNAAGWLDSHLERWAGGTAAEQVLAFRVTLRAETTTAGVQRLLQLLESENIPPSEIAAMGYGGWHLGLKAEVVRPLIIRLVAKAETRALGLQVMSGRLHRGRPADTELIDCARVIAGDMSLLVQGGSMAHHYWIRVVTGYPEVARIALETLFAAQAEPRWYLDHHKSLTELLLDLATEHPTDAWLHLSASLEGNAQSHLYGFPSAILNVIETETILAWVEGHPETRGLLVAHIVPVNIEEDTLFGQLVVRYGTTTEISSRLLSRLQEGVFWGEYSTQLESAAGTLKDAAERSNHPVLRRWAAKGAEAFRAAAEEARAEEEDRRKLADLS